MCLSVFLAKVIGLYLVLLSLGLVVHQQRFKRLVSEFSGYQPLLAVLGAIGVMVGLVIVVAHNVWALDWRVLITLFGWVTLLHGLARFFFPDHCVKTAKNLIHKKGFAIWNWIWFLIGLYLVWVGFSAA